jgi:hypothetical protein
MKLPKQWKDWCRAARLRQRDEGRDKRGLGSGWFYLHGHGREWRLNCHNMIQCGDTYADFDRWALCDIREAPAPTTRAEFVAVVRALVAAHDA